VARLIADAELMTDVARILQSTGMAETKFHGVCIGGHEVLDLSCSWASAEANPARRRKAAASDFA